MLDTDMPTPPSVHACRTWRGVGMCRGPKKQVKGREGQVKGQEQLLQLPAARPVHETFYSIISPDRSPGGETWAPEVQSQPAGSGSQFKPTA